MLRINNKIEVSQIQGWGWQTERVFLATEIVISLGTEARKRIALFKRKFRLFGALHGKNVSSVCGHGHDQS